MTFQTSLIQVGRYDIAWQRKSSGKNPQMDGYGDMWWRGPREDESSLEVVDGQEFNMGRIITYGGYCWRIRRRNSRWLWVQIIARRHAGIRIVITLMPKLKKSTGLVFSSLRLGDSLHHPNGRTSAVYPGSGF